MHVFRLSSKAVYLSYSPVPADGALCIMNSGVFNAQKSTNNDRN